MIESKYWRSELKVDLVWLEEHQTYRRWSERKLVLFERKLMLCAFQVRSLLERPKVNDRARNTVMPVLRYKKISELPFTVTSPGWPDELFDLENPEPAFLSTIDVCNQLIHYYWMQTSSKGMTFTSMLVFSDYMRHKFAYEFRVDSLLKLFQVFAHSSSSIAGMESEWDEKRRDYVVKRAWGRADLPPNPLQGLPR